MTIVRTRLHVAADGTITGRAPRAVPPGEHEAEILVAAAPALSEAELVARVRALQEEAARLPVRDSRSADEILGYNAAGLFD